MTRTPIVWFAFSIPLAACVGSPDSDSELEPYQVEAVCYRWDCGEDFDECQAEVSREEGACFRFCAGSCSCDYTNEFDRCRSRYCDDWDPCIHHYYDAEPGGLDEVVLAACDQAGHQLGMCGNELRHVYDCELFARSFDRSSAAVFDCIATSPCDETANCDGPADEVSAAQMCSAIEECQASLDSCEDGRLMGLFGLLRADARDAGLSCLDLPCDQRISCILGFFEPFDPWHTGSLSR